MNGYIKKIGGSITKKILLLIVLSIGASFLVSILIMKKVQDSYSDYVYETKTDLLNNSMAGIEEILLGYENSTYQFITGSKTQQLMSRFLEASNRYDAAEEQLSRGEVDDLPSVMAERRSARGLKAGSVIKILKELDTYLSRIYQADTGYFIDRNNNQYSGYGSSRVEVSKEILHQISEEARERKGGLVYRVIDIRYGVKGEQRKEVVIARSVQEKQNLTMEYCGTVIYMINPEMLAASYMTDLNGLFILEENGGVVFSSINKEEREEFLKKIPCINDKYEIVRLAGKKYFITSIKSDKLNWRYYNISDYNQLFSGIQNMAVLYSVLLLAVLVGIGGIASSVSVTLVKPVVTLSEKIASIRKDKDPVKALETLEIKKKKRDDEIGRLEEEFSKMICELSELIHENYEQKIYLQNAQLSALRSKLNPHFLYNTLDTIRWLASDQTYRQIPSVVKALGDILRISINSRESLIPLEQELEYMRGYLTIQRARFGQRLNVQIDAEEHFMEVKIPAFSLQPLVENSVHYALERMSGVCTILVTVAEEEEDLLCTVSDNGTGLDPDILDKLRLGTIKAEGSGIGLTNLNERLKNLYGREYGLSVVNGPSGGAVISFRIKREALDCYETDQSDDCR